MTPETAIGSVLPLPETGPPGTASLWSAWTAGRPAAAFRSARAALAALLITRGAQRLWLPAYACAALAEAAAFAGVEACWYGVDARMTPDAGRLEEGLRSGDAVLVVAYFGRSPPVETRALAQARRDVVWIEDRAQALAPDGPRWADVELYSPRKLIGVPDGGLLVGEGGLPAPEAGSAPPVDATAQRARAADPDGLRPESWYAAFRAQEAAFDARPLGMSDLTRELLQAIDPTPLADRRRANYAALAAALPAYALWPEANPPFAPLAFPVLLRDRDGVVSRMAAGRIYCARHWPDLPSPAEAFPDVHALNGELLSIPCDHRYSADDMARVAERLRAVARPV